MIQHEWEELLSAYADGEVTPAERSAVEALLETTPDARTALDEMRGLSQMLRSLPREAAPAELKASVLRVVETHKTPVVAAATRRFRSYRREWLAGFSAIAATVLVAGLLSLQFRSGLTTSREHAASSAVSADGVVVLHSANGSDWNEFLADDARDHRRLGEPAEPRGSAVRTAVRAEAATDRFGVTTFEAPQSAPLDEKLSRSGANSLVMGELAKLDGTADGESNAEVERLREVLPYLRLQDEDGLSVGNVSLVVIDAQRVANQFQLLLVKNGVQTVDVTTVDFDAVAAPADAPVPSSRPTAPSEAADDGLYAVYTEAPVEPLSKTLEELIQQREVLGLKLQPPLQMSNAAQDRARGVREAERRLSVKQLQEAYVVQKLDEELVFRESEQPANALEALSSARGGQEGRDQSRPAAAELNRRTQAAPTPATGVATASDPTVAEQQVYFNTLVKLPAPAAEQAAGLDVQYRNDLRQNFRQATPANSASAATVEDLQQMRSRFARTAPDTVRLLFVFQPVPTPASPAPQPSGR